MKKKIAIVFGTRPEAIKLVPVVLAFQKQENVEVEIVLTGQHKEMLDQVIDLFGLTPTINFNLMRKNQTLGQMTSSMMDKLYHYFAENRADLIVVQGDTATTFVGALVAFYHKIPVAYVEAGLRTGNLYSPWPEEGNRLMTSQISTLFFAPTNDNKDNLLKEGFEEATIKVTGNTSIDTLLILKDILQEKEADYLAKFDAALLAKPFVLITGHRRENFGQGFDNICNAIRELAEQFPDHNFIYPVHLNPNVREPVERILNTEKLQNIHLLDPLNYDDFVFFMMRSKLVLTDSGGIQEEAPSLGKPVLVMRENTERPEAVKAGTSKLVGTSKEGIVDGVKLLLTDESVYNTMAQTKNPYGEGIAAQIIAKDSINYLNAN